MILVTSAQPFWWLKAQGRMTLTALSQRLALFSRMIRNALRCARAAVDAALASTQMACGHQNTEARRR